MDRDKQWELVDDARESGMVSSCCGATLYHFNDGCGICGDCKEWAGGEAEEE